MVQLVYLTPRRILLPIHPRRIQALTDTAALAEQAALEYGSGAGRCQQAFCCAAQHELHTFLKLMAYLESFLKAPIPLPGGAQAGRVSCSCGCVLLDAATFRNQASPTLLGSQLRCRFFRPSYCH